MTVHILVAVVLALLGIGLGWMLGRGRERPIPPDPHPAALDRLGAELRRGSLGAEDPGEPRGVTEVRRAVAATWIPADQSREEALKQALGRIAAFLEGRVQEPLTRVREGDPGLLREGIDRALGGLQDLEFHLREPLTPDETHNLVSVVQQVAREFIADSETGVRFAAPAFPVQARIHRGRFLDAVYLLLNNAGHFGEGKTVDVTVEKVGDEATVTIRDRGPGFSPEALERAHDLFYTTRPEALGLGLPFARKIIEGFGGRIDLGNHAEGGGVVTVFLPGA
ncbi:sensor histidine kinase [Gaopeijia maritima]|uniref:sensor histidine kinase n=1 Tax=Gaopeijia maritima TaxID=3119007 RepID=UPI0032550B00